MQEAGGRSTQGQNRDGTGGVGVGGTWWGTAGNGNMHMPEWWWYRVPWEPEWGGAG